MHGNPPLHLTLAIIGFMLLAIPLAQLTFARTTAKPNIPAHTVPTVDSSITNNLLRVRFAHLPKRLTLLYGDKVLMDLKSDTAISPVEQSLKLTIPKDGVEFVLNAEWPEGTPDTALTLELEPDGLDTKSVTRWSSGARIKDVVSFTW